MSKIVAILIGLVLVYICIAFVTFDLVWISRAGSWDYSSRAMFLYFTFLVSGFSYVVGSK
jgi:hypothetical protein